MEAAYKAPPWEANVMTVKPWRQQQPILVTALRAETTAVGPFS